MRSIDLLPNPVALARQQRRDDAVGNHDPAHLVGDAAVDIGRRLVWSAYSVHHSGTRLPQVIERGTSALRALGTVPRGACIDQAWVARAQVLAAESQSPRHSLAESLDEDVALLGEPVDDLARLGMLEIDCETLLVAVVCFKIVTARRDHAACAGNQSAAGVTPFQLLELDDFGAQVAEHRSRNWSLLPDGPVDHADSVERRFHDPRIYHYPGRQEHP